MSCCFWFSNDTIENSGLSIRAGSRPKQPATGKTLAGYFRITLMLILVRNINKEEIQQKQL